MGPLVAQKKRRRRPRRLTTRRRLGLLEPARRNPLMVPLGVHTHGGTIYEVREVHGDEEVVFEALAEMADRDQAPAFALVADEWVILGPPSTETHTFLLTALTQWLQEEGDPMAFRVQQSRNLAAALWLDRQDGEVIQIDCIGGTGWREEQIESMRDSYLHEMAEDEQHLLELMNNREAYSEATSYAEDAVDEGAAGHEWESSEFQDNLINLIEMLDLVGKVSGEVHINYVPFGDPGSAEKIGAVEDFV